MQALILLFVYLLNMEGSDTTRITYADARTLFETQNQLLKAARERIATAHADLVSSKLFPNPQISANGSFIGLFTTPVDYSSTQTVFRVDQTVPIGPKRGYRIQEAQHSYMKAIADFNDIHRQLFFDMKEAFVQTAYMQLVYQLAQKNHQLISRIIEASKERLRAGDISEMEFKELSLDEAGYVNAENEARQNLTEAVSQLRTMLGLEPSKPVSVIYNLNEQVKSDTILVPKSRAVRLAFENRQDLKSLLEEVDAATYHVKAAYAAIIPDVDLGVELDRQGPNFQNTVGGGVSLAIPLFNRNQDEIERSDANLKSARASLENLKLQIKNEVESAYMNYESSLKSFKSFFSNLIGNADTVREMSAKDYLTGNVGLVDFLQAQRIYTDAVQSYYDSLLKVEKNKIALERTIGIELPKEGE